jgi:hypothetical protein
MPNCSRIYLFVLSSKDCIKRVGSSDHFAQSACATVGVAVLTNATEVGTHSTAVWPCFLLGRQVAQMRQSPFLSAVRAPGGPDGPPGGKPARLPSCRFLAAVKAATGRSRPPGGSLLYSYSGYFEARHRASARLRDI